MLNNLQVISFFSWHMRTNFLLYTLSHLQLCRSFGQVTEFMQWKLGKSDIYVNSRLRSVCDLQRFSFFLLVRCDIKCPEGHGGWSHKATWVPVLGGESEGLLLTYSKRQMNTSMWRHWYLVFICYIGKWQLWYSNLYSFSFISQNVNKEYVILLQ
jgi:hypothetical protein